MSYNTTTSVLSKTEMTYEQLVASNLTKLLYLINGTGSDRDRTIQLSTLRKWILEGVSDADFNNVDIAGILSLSGSPASTEIVKGRVTVSTSTSKAEITNAGIEISGTDQEPTTEIKKNGMTVGNDTVVDKDKVAANKVETAQFRATSYVKTSASYTLAHHQQSSGNDKEGDIAIVYNNGTSAITVTIAMPSGGSARTVSLNPGCTLPFLCVSEAETSNYSEWSPIANVQIY